MGKRERNLQLSFERTECERCNDLRERKHPCPICGQKPNVHETQPDLDRRRVIFKRLQDSRAKKEPGPFPDDPVRMLSRVMDRALAALAEVSRGGYNAQPLIVAFSDLDQLVANTRTPRLRPHLNDGRRSHKLAEAVRALLDEFAATLTAPHMGEAQRLEERANEDFNLAVAEFAPTVRDNLEAALSEPGAPGLELIGAYHRQQAGEVGLEEWATRLGNSLGLPGSQPELHLIVDVLDLASVGLDRDLVNELAARTEEHLNTASALLRRHDVLADIATCQRLVDGAYAVLLSTVQNDEDEWNIVNSAFSLAVVLRERGLSRLVAVLQARDDPDGYPKNRTRGVGSLLKDSANTIPQFGLHDLAAPLRHAFSHQDFELDGGDVLLDGGKTRITAEEAVDLVLQAVEVYNGLLLGVVRVLLRHDIALPVVTSRGPRHREASVQYVLAWQGATSIQVHESADAVHISATGTDLDWLGTVAVLSAVFEQNAKRLRLTIRDGDSDRELDADITPFHEWSSDQAVDRTESETHMLFLRTAAAVLLDGTTPTEPELWLGAARFYADPTRNPVSLEKRRRDVSTVRELAVGAGVVADGIDQVAAKLDSEQEEQSAGPSERLRLSRQVALASLPAASCGHRWPSGA